MEFTNYVIRWRPEVKNLFNADAEKVATEINSLGEGVTPKMIVEKGRDESTELHKVFEWDDSIAAEMYREDQARKVVRCIVYEKKEVQDHEQEPIQFRVFHHDDNNGGYTNLKIIMRSEERYKTLLEEAMEELQRFKAKYNCLAELKPIMDLIP